MRTCMLMETWLLLNFCETGLEIHFSCVCPAHKGCADFQSNILKLFFKARIFFLNWVGVLWFFCLGFFLLLVGLFSVGGVVICKAFYLCPGLNDQGFSLERLCLLLGLLLDGMVERT